MNITVLWLSYIYHINPHTLEDGFYIETGPRMYHFFKDISFNLPCNIQNILFIEKFGWKF